MHHQLLGDHRHRGFEDRHLAGHLARPMSNIKVDFTMTITLLYFTKLSTSQCCSAQIGLFGSSGSDWKLQWRWGLGFVGWLIWAGLMDHVLRDWDSDIGDSTASSGSPNTYICHLEHLFWRWYLVATDTSVWAECTQLYKIFYGYSFRGGTTP